MPQLSNFQKLNACERATSSQPLRQLSNGLGSTSFGEFGVCFITSSYLREYSVQNWTRCSPLHCVKREHTEAKSLTWAWPVTWPYSNFKFKADADASRRDIPNAASRISLRCFVLEIIWGGCKECPLSQWCSDVAQSSAGQLSPLQGAVVHPKYLPEGGQIFRGPKTCLPKTKQKINGYV